MNLNDRGDVIDKPVPRIRWDGCLDKKAECPECGCGIVWPGIRTMDYSKGINGYRVDFTCPERHTWSEVFTYVPVRSEQVRKAQSGPTKNISEFDRRGRRR